MVLADDSEEAVSNVKGEADGEPYNNHRTVLGRKLGHHTA